VTVISELPGVTEARGRLLAQPIVDPLPPQVSVAVAAGVFRPRAARAGTNGLREAGMIGAQALLRTLTGCGVEVCFSNPGTSEMHFVAALDGVPEMRGVLCLFEGAATGAADGYGRMTGRPAAALLHLGPGLANGLANLHNARRAHTPLLAVVGDHATWHKQFDSPLESDIDALAGAVSVWVQRPARSAEVAVAAATAVAAAVAPPGGVATLVQPADVSWSGGAMPAPPLPVPAPAPVPDEMVGAAAAALRSGEPCMLLLGGDGMRRPGLAVAAPVASGSPWPIAPPVRVSQSCGGAPAVAAGSHTPLVLASSETIAPPGSSAPITAAADSPVRSPSGSAGRAGSWGRGLVSGATRSASAVSAPPMSSPPSASRCTWQPPGTRELGLPG